jgi:hypothetical protein
VNHEKRKMLNNQEKFKNTPGVDSIITAIENHQLNMVQCAQYNINQQFKSLLRNHLPDKNPSQ